WRWRWRWGRRFRCRQRIEVHRWRDDHRGLAIARLARPGRPVGLLGLGGLVRVRGELDRAGWTRSLVAAEGDDGVG
ncbi:MAG TPA: hypothetical protein DCS55_03055, partial [Acidimicrobiaceae bacterium]|nr:hypothetical protein [Acidimicrobiaceae bacterium]